MNRNDLRFIKTERLIEDTYLALKRKSRGPIKVNTLCEAALINKTTFYAHYETMEALHSHVCIKTVEQLLDRCPNIDDAFLNMNAFVDSLMATVQENETFLDVLFGGDKLRQVNVFESCLLKRYLQEDCSPEMEMQIIFALGGAARLLITNHNEERVEMTTRLIRKIFDR